MKPKDSKSVLADWLNGKPAVLGWVGWQIAVYADGIILLINSALSGKLNTKLPPAPQPQAMLRMHRDPKEMMKELIDIMFEGGGAKALELNDTFNAFMKQSEAERKAAVEEIVKAPEFLEIYRKMAAELGEILGEMYRGMMAELRGDKSEVDVPPGFLESVAVQFLVRVLTPCLALYGEMPHKMFERAQQGDDEALLKLLALDKSILADEVIGGRLQQAEAAGNAAFVSDFANAVRREFKPLKRRQVKIRLAALLSKVALTLNVKVEAPEIQALFDAVASEKSKERTTDPDLYTDTASLARMIRMERLELKILKDVKGGGNLKSKPSG